MKKFTFMLMAAFIAVAAFAAGPEKRGMQALNPGSVMTSSVKQVTPKSKATDKVLAPVANKMMRNATTRIKKAPKKAGLEDLLSVQWMLCSDYYEYNSETEQLEPSIPEAGGTPVTFTLGESMQPITIAINGFTSYATEAIEATVNLTDDEELLAQGIVAEISIADGQTLYENETYGPIVLKNFSGEEEGEPITGYFYEDGFVAFNGIWADVLAEGEYAGSLWSGYYYSSFAQPVNGTMAWGSKEEPVVIYQDENYPKYVTVYNFAGWGTAINVTMKEDKTFVIDNQPVEDGGSSYGIFYTYGLNNAENSLIALTGVGTETTLTFDCKFTAYSPTSTYWYGAQEPAVITLAQGEFLYPVIEDVAAVPATPEPRTVGNYDKKEGYGYFSFTIPTTDVDGNDLRESNLFYQLYSDIEGDIQPIVFTPEICEKLTEDMTIIPYTFTDNWDFADKGTYKVVYLNYNFNEMYDRIGVKSIYTGGGETHESEIAWAEVEKPEPVELGGTFNFNEMDVPTSSNVSQDGDITEPLTLSEGNVTLVISEKTATASTENRFWSTSNGPQLRMYSGTLTFTVPVGYAITAMTINYGRFNAGNTITPGALTDDAENKVATWTLPIGAELTQEVVITIAGNTQINSIDVEVEEAAVNYDLVVLPEGVEPEVWTIEGVFADSYGSDEIQRATEVAFDGTDVYVKGIPFYFEDAWMKGTLDTETGIVTFPSGQYVGEDEYGLEFMIGCDDGETICDIEFAYDAEAKTLTQITKYIIENGDTYTEIYSYGYWYNMVIYAGEPVVIDPVTAPEGLETETYVFTAQVLTASEDDEEEVEVEDYSYQTQVGFDGQNVYFKGFSQDTSDFWAKGTLSEDGKTVTIPASQYMGMIEFWGYKFKYYVTSVDEDGNLTDLVLNYDAETNTFTTEQALILNDNKSSLNPYQTFTSVVITKMQDVAATPADPVIEDFVLSETTGYSKIYASIPTEDVEGNELLISKLFYTLYYEAGEEGEQVYTFTADLYGEDFEQDVTEVPYVHDGYDIYAGGQIIYLEETLEELTTWNKIGLKSIYYGGDERHESNIVWFENPAYNPTGIANINADKEQKVIYNIAGQRVQKLQKGLYIVNGKKVAVK